eukprot:scaffold114414_cov18-Prasinocladus_malaysianus.AAC.1
MATTRNNGRTSDQQNARQVMLLVMVSCCICRNPSSTATKLSTFGRNGRCCCLELIIRAMST